MTGEEFFVPFGEPCDLTAEEMENSEFGAWDFVFYTLPDAQGRLRAWTYDLGGTWQPRRLPARDLRLVKPEEIPRRGGEAG